MHVHVCFSLFFLYHWAYIIIDSLLSVSGIPNDGTTTSTALNNTEMSTTIGPDDPYYSVLPDNSPPSERAPYQPIDVGKTDYASIYTTPDKSPLNERAAYEAIDVRKTDYISVYAVPKRDKWTVELNLSSIKVAVIFI